MKNIKFASGLISHKNLAFTLAETLITLGIIGVVVAVTVPSLYTGHQKRVYVSTLQKIYNDVNQALGRYMSDQRVETLNESRLSGSADGLKDFIRTYLNVTRDCGESYLPCFAPQYSSINGTLKNINESAKCDASFTLLNGAAICANSQARVSTPTEGEETQNSNHVGSAGDVITFEVDINGPKEPNKYGRDYFSFQVDRNGQIFDKFFDEDEESVDLNTATPDNGAFGKIVSDGWDMKY